MPHTLTLGSLFDGIGGFPLAASHLGVTPVWASEIEPFPILVTRSRVPGMKHLGDVSRIDGAAIEPVDILTFGFPCQDHSNAGKREGFRDGKRSVLFFQATRIIREMLAATGGTYPRAVIVENVPGLLSSGVKGKGKEKDYLNGDFAVVLKTLQDLGFLLDPNILDAQFMGVPQRRRRVYVAGFNTQVIERWPEYEPGQADADGTGQISLFGDCDDCDDNLMRLRACAVALERYFGGLGRKATEKAPVERKGVSGDTAPRDQAREGTSGDFENGTVGADRAVEPGCVGFGETGVGYWQNGIQTLRARSDRPSWPSNVVVETWPDIVGSLLSRADSSPCVDRGQPFVAIGIDEECNAVVDGMGTLMAHTSGGSRQYVGIFAARQGETAGSIAYSKNVSPTLRSTVEAPSIVYACRTDQTGSNGLGVCENVSHTLDGANGQSVIYDARGNGDGQPAPTVTGDHNGHISDYTAIAIDCRNHIDNIELSGIIQAKPGGGTSLNFINPVLHIKDAIHWIVRRLTPLETLRLQGFPDGWCDGLAIENPTEADIDWWQDVFETHRRIVNPDGKPKTRKQIAKWLRNPYSDSAVYKAAGNSVAIPCVAFVLGRIAEILSRRV